MNQKVLVVDDEKSFRDSIRLFLEDYDFDIEEAENGRICTEKILSLKPDLVLIDLYMPEMTGLDVLQWVSKHAPDQPIIIISGAGVIHDVAEALRRGAWDYIFKPIEDLGVLKHAVDRALERAQFIKANRNYQQHLESEVTLRTNDLRKANMEMVKKQDKILRAGIEEQVLAELLQITLQCKDEIEFLNATLKLILDKLAEWHQIHQGVVYHLSAENEIEAEKWELLTHVTPTELQQYQDENFIGCLKKQLRLPLNECLNPTVCIQHSVCVLPIKHNSHVSAVFVLALDVKAQDFSNSDIRFLTRISDVLGMGLGKFSNERQIQFLAYHDVLTGLANRRMLLERLEQNQKVVTRNPWSGVLLFIDLDRFKYLNDSLGHDVGDELLRQAAKRLEAATRDEDLVARLGGDEFVVLIIEHKPDSNALLVDIQKVIDKIQQALNLPYSLKQHDYYLTCSIGVCVYGDDTESAVDLLKHADTAMHRAKEKGGDISRFYEPEMQRAADARLIVEKDLRVALDNQQLELYYQPQLNTESGRIIGAEALVRWNHPERGLVPPMSFIPVAEETGMITDLGEWVICDALSQIFQWVSAGLLTGVGSIAINICPQQFRQPDFVEMLTDYIKTSKVTPDLIKLEITESTLIDNVEETIDKMNQLKDFGLCLSMDDFGTGYSSLSYLKRLPLDQLKIDRSFVQDIADDKNDAAIVETIIAMGKHMGMDVIAEGVETQDVLDLLKQRGCASYQGYLFSKPVPAKEFEQLLKRQNSRTA